MCVNVFMFIRVMAVNISKKLRSAAESKLNPVKQK